MVEKFLRTLTGPCGVSRGSSVLVCCSGGIDSMVLLSLMNELGGNLGLSLGVIHVEHGLRGEASRQDARFVEKSCSSLGIPFFMRKLDMSAHTPNMEESARLRRYEAIRECMQANGFDHAATGHNLDDQAETVLFRLIRGSGIRGITGIDYARENLVRPLLDCSRVEIEEYARSRGISHVEDLSNRDTKISRNLIRHEILPLMKTINPVVTESIARFASIARQEGAALGDMAEDLYSRALLYDWKLVKVLDAEVLSGANDAVCRRVVIAVISEMLGEPRGIDSIQIESVMDVLRGETAAHEIKRRIRIGRSGNLLFFRTSIRGPYYSIDVKTPGEFEIVPLDMKIIVDGRSVIRSPLEGDAFGRHKVYGLLSRRGVPRPLRPFWPVAEGPDGVTAVARLVNKDHFEMEILYER